MPPNMKAFFQQGGRTAQVDQQGSARNDIGVEIRNPNGAGDVVVLCEHASNDIPARYGGLGLAAQDAQSHAAWDPGARAVALLLAQALDAPLVASRVSRLVYDCNRPPDSPGAMPARSELIEVPGNRDLTDEQRQERIDTIYRPFTDTVSDLLDSRRTTASVSALITVHSFTPVYYGKPREVEIGILHDSDTRLADLMLAEAGRLPHRVIRRNDPYGPEDGVTHTLRLHGIRNGLPNVMVEIRNDLIATPQAQETLAGEMLQLIRPALHGLQEEGR